MILAGSISSPGVARENNTDRSGENNMFSNESTSTSDGFPGRKNSGIPSPVVHPGSEENSEKNRFAKSNARNGSDHNKKIEVQ